MNIRKFNENTIDVVDPTEDVLLFRNMFPKESNSDFLSPKLISLENEHTNQTSDYDVYQILEYDDDKGRNSTNLVYIRGVSKFHSLIKACVKLNNSELCQSGWYDARKLRKGELSRMILEEKNRIRKLLKSIEESKELVENAKNPY